MIKINYKENIRNELKERYRYKLELHAHTSPASSCSEIPPAEWIDLYHAHGYSGMAFTNHLHMTSIDKNGGSKEAYLDFIMGEFDKVCEEADKKGMKAYLGAELRFENENDNDYLLFGVDRNIMKAAVESVYYDVETFVNNYKDERSFFVQAHPFRTGQIHDRPELLDGIEVFNMHPNHNSRVALAEKWAEENGKIKTCGTDFHHHGHEGLCATRTQWLPEDSFDIVKLYRENDFIFEVGSNLIIP